MKRFIKHAIAWFLLFLLGVSLGYFLSRPIRVSASGGPGPASPNARFWATAFSWHERHLLGHSQNRTYSEFVIQTPPPDSVILRRVRIEDSFQSPSIDWREEGSVQWATNSSAVTFSYDGPKMKFLMILKLEPGSEFDFNNTTNSVRKND